MIVESDTDWVKKQAFDCGFDLVGITTCDSPDHFSFYREWLSRGFGADMTYLERHAELKDEPRKLLPEAKTAVVVGYNYYFPLEQLQQAFKVARYALGDDYHKLMKKMLESLARVLQEKFLDLSWRSFVDSGPLLERELGKRAGMGWFGKNTLLIHPQKGSWFLLGCLLINVELIPDPPFENLHCGTCTRCLDACPTNAFVAPYTLDANRCISYLTIENRASISQEYRSLMGDNIFGCDICQEVCPWNKKFQKLSAHTELYPRDWIRQYTLEQLLLLSEDQFKELTIKSPIKRPKYLGFIRNIAMAIGNSGEPAHISALQEALVRHQEPMLQEHIQWALERLTNLSE